MPRVAVSGGQLLIAYLWLVTPVTAIALMLLVSPISASSSQAAVASLALALLGRTDG